MTVQDTCTLRCATNADRDAVEAFLQPHAATSMFLRANMLAHGLQERSDPHGMALFVSGEAQIDGVFAVTNGGYLLAQAPRATATHWTAFRKAIAGRKVKGMTGVKTQVEQALRSLGLADHEWKLRRDEPLYYLVLSDLRDIAGQVRPPVQQDWELLIAWYADYCCDVGQMPRADTTDPEVLGRAERAIAAPGDLVLLEVAGRPVAMAGINARLPDCVQIGSVFTPRALRGRGHARAALAGLLRDCAAQGITRSILFAANAAAARAYEALGYDLIGTYQVALLSEPCVVAP